jgi:hypothetical protein
MAAPAGNAQRVSPDGNTIINVLFAYGESSDVWYQDNISAVHWMVANANTVLENSGIPARLKAVGTTRLADYTKTYEDSHSFDQLLTAVTEPADGELDGIHTWRSQLQADLVVLLTEKPESCGRSWQYDGRPEYGFAVVNRGCGVTNRA